MSDKEVIQLVESKNIPSYKLESALEDHERGVAIRRQMVGATLRNTQALDKLPYSKYDYTYVSINVYVLLPFSF